MSRRLDKVNMLVLSLNNHERPGDFPWPFVVVHELDNFRGTICVGTLSTKSCT